MVENAIEHGIEKRASGGLLRIGVVRDNGFLTLSVYNEVRAFPGLGAAPRRGVGIANVRSRLRTLYGESSQLKIENREQGVEVQLSVPHKPKMSSGACSRQNPRPGCR